MSARETVTQSERPCPISGSRDVLVVATKAREGHPLRNVISVESGLIFVDPLPIDDLEGFYKEDYRVSYKGTFTPKPKHVHRAGTVAIDRYRHSGELMRKGMRCLDIGAGGGEWVYLLKQLGCDSVGIEPNQGYGSFARDQYGVEVFLGMYQEASFEKESFDVLTLFQVLEHLADPVSDLVKMSEYLRPGGRFVIEVPDILFPGMRFDHKWHDGHLFGFDALTLEAVAASAGLRKLSIDVLPGNLFGVFEKAEGVTPDPRICEGHFDEALRLLEKGTSRYWRLPRTYTKIPRRLRKRAREKWQASRFGNPRAILDYLYGASVGARQNLE
ncbi:MAG: class I SAM-dependent methyltransferase [Verrucomicrobiota bacterium]